MTPQPIDGVRAAVWDGTELVVDDISVLPPGAGEVTVRVLASGICHSDLNVMGGRSPIPAPVVLGHEGAGVIERVGDGVDGTEVGDEVMISSMTPCGDCPACRAHRPSRCRSTYGRPSFPFMTGASAIEAADVVIECSGSPPAISAVLHVAPTVALVGIPPADTELRIDARSLALGRRLVGSLNGDIVPDRDLPTILGLVRDGTLDVGAQVGGVWPLGRIDDAIAAVRAGDVIRATLDMARDLR